MAKIKKEWVSWEEFRKYGLADYTGDEGSYYTKTEIDAFFEGEASGKKQVHWDRVTNKPSTYPPDPHNHDDRYYTESELNGGQLDSRYYTESEIDSLLAGQDELSELGDVSLSTPADDDILIYDSVMQKWKNSATLPTHYHDDRYYTESEIDTKLALQDALAEMDDVYITSPQDGEMLVYDTETQGGKWIASSELPSHNHDDRYYTESELDGGQLDNRYFRENEHIDTSSGVGDAGKPIKLNASGLVDNSMIPGGGQDELVKVGASGGADYLNENYFQRDITNHVRIKLNTLLTDVNADMWDGYHFADYLDQAVKQGSDVIHHKLDIKGTLNAAANLLSLYNSGAPAADKIRWDWQIQSNNKDIYLRAYNGTTHLSFIKFLYDSSLVEFSGCDIKALNKLYIGASYYLDNNGLVANNKVSDSDKWDGYQFADYLNQAMKTTSIPSFYGLNISKPDNANYIKIGQGQTSDQQAYIDLIGDTTYTDYAIRIIRYATGINATSEILHRGTGYFTIKAVNAGSLILGTTNTARLKIEPAGAFDFYNNELKNFSKLTFGSYYLDSLTANNKVPDSDKWDNHQFADYLDQGVKTTSSPTFLDLKVSSIARDGASLQIEYNGLENVRLFANAPPGSNKFLYLYGYQTGVGKKYGRLQVGADGYFYIDGELGVKIENKDINDFISNPMDEPLEIDVTSGDPYVRFDINNVEKWRLGVDDDDADKFKIHTGDFIASSLITLDRANSRVGINYGTPAVDLHVNGEIRSQGGNIRTGNVFVASTGATGVTDTFTGGGGETITVVDGIITNIA